MERHRTPRGCIFLSPSALLADRRQRRLTRMNDANTAEDDYHRFSNRNH